MFLHEKITGRDKTGLSADFNQSVPSEWRYIVEAIFWLQTERQLTNRLCRYRTLSCIHDARQSGSITSLMPISYLEDVIIIYCIPAEHHIEKATTTNICIIPKRQLVRPAKCIKCRPDWTEAADYNMEQLHKKLLVTHRPRKQWAQALSMASVTNCSRALSLFAPSNSKHSFFIQILPILFSQARTFPLLQLRTPECWCTLRSYTPWADSSDVQQCNSDVNGLGNKLIWVPWLKGLLGNTILLW